MAVAEFSERSVRRVADARSFERGRAYFAKGRVRKLSVDGAAVTATVVGTSAYRVRLEIGARDLSGDCSCPYGREGVFCKHCVAVALAWLDEGGKVGEPSTHAVPDERLLAFLRDQDPEWLAAELLSAARNDPRLRARLEIAAGADAELAYDDRGLREHLARAIKIGDFVDYAETHGYFLGVREALDALAELIDGGFPDAARDLAEYALELLEDTQGRVDDSEGGLVEALNHAEAIHLRACLTGRPEPVRLAESLFERALASDLGAFLDALPDYEPALGQAGVARYRDLVERAWHDLPPKQPHDYDGRRFAVTHLTERLAECYGGADELVEVLARDVTSSHDMLRIAERLRADGHDEEALAWLERGMAEFPPDPRLRTLAAECHVRAGRPAEANELVWQNFAEWPTLENYVALHEVADAQFPVWRDRALELLRAQPIAKDRSLPGSGHSTLVEVLLWEGDVDAAWQAAVHRGCLDGLWLRLARQRADTHPEDAIPVLLDAADTAIAVKDRDSYRHAAALLSEAHRLAARCDRVEDFESHLAELRRAHRAKRALREELDRARLP